jgi:hypothetical protein
VKDFKIEGHGNPKIEFRGFFVYYIVMELISS